PGDRLLVVSENAPALVGAILAASRRDVWVIPLNARLTGAEVDRIAAHSGARRILYTSGVSPEAAAHGARAGAEEIDLGALGRVMLSPENPEATPEPVEEGPGQVAALVYTTGTTGNPK
ncbi:MAG TPA: long-chain fatty acid--CoA ligase, partial [Tistrella mobilis]|nr:long-chain fatty acid--CoA ligase [Tistrella mobilis]